MDSSAGTGNTRLSVELTRLTPSVSDYVWLYFVSFRFVSFRFVSFVETYIL